MNEKIRFLSLGLWLSFVPLGLGQTAADFFAQGDLKLQRRDWTGAIADFDRAIALNPQDSKAYIWRGKAKWSQNDLDGAIEDETRAIGLDSRAAPAYSFRGSIRKIKGDLDGAIADLTESLSLEPAFPPAWFMRGEAKARKKDLDGAESDYLQAIALGPKWKAVDVAYLGLSRVKMAKDDLDGALESLSKAIAANPRNAIAYAERGVVEQAKGDAGTALRDYTTFSELHPGDADYGHWLMWVTLSQQGKREEADRALSNYWKSRPVQSGSDWSGKVGKFLLGTMSESDLLKEAATDPKSLGRCQAEAYYYIGVKRLLAGDGPSARTDFRKSVAADSLGIDECFLARAELRNLGQE